MNEKQYLSIERLLELSEEKLEEPRRTSGNYRHKLVDVFVISLLGIMTGLEDWIAIEDYANAKQEWLKTFLELPNGAPSNDTYRRVFERLKPDQIESVYREWVMPYIGGCAGKQVAIDGKTICGASAAREKNEKEAEGKLHMISAWICEDRISIAQVKTNEKSNEITKIPELLSTLDVRGSVVTIDAMGTQTAIAKKIVEEEADYVLGLKQNQPTLYRDVKERKIVLRLASGATIDELLQENWKSDELFSLLLQLEMRNYIVKLSGGRYQTRRQINKAN